MRWLLRLYPRAWRERYGEEFAALLEARGLTPAVIMDVLLGALDAQLRPQAARSSWRPPPNRIVSPRKE